LGLDFIDGHIFEVNIFAGPVFFVLLMFLILLFLVLNTVLGFEIGVFILRVIFLV